ncbi:MAG: hypothetical protein ACE5GC_04450 [Acidimicrobiia bacterium]
MDLSRLTALVESSDLDELVRFIDGLVAAREWDGLVTVRDRCREAVERGKQVWGAAEFAEYRIALDAPGPQAASVLRPGAGRFGNGPLWEVAASTHTWAELESVTDAAFRALLAHERTLRGDAIDDAGIDRLVVDAPLAIAPWEPRYPVAVYRSDGADFPEVDVPDLEWIDLPEPASPVGRSDAAETLLDLVQPWLDDSSGRGEALAVEGTAEGAIRALGPHRVRAVDVDLATAMGVMCWAGASGGAYGRRRGTPVGRALAWWTMAVLLGLEEDWPISGDEMGEEAAALRWVAWDPGDAGGGWRLHLAVEDPEEGLAWAVSAVDAR